MTQAIIGCHPRYPAPIDHIIVGGLASDNVTFSPLTRYYEDMSEDAIHTLPSIYQPLSLHS